MYFWKIDSLKQDLAAKSLTERDSLLYILWLGSVTGLLYLIPLGDFNVWDYVWSAGELAIFVAGTIYFYRCNGGINGSGLVLKFVTLYWVFGIRFLFLVAIPGIFLMIFVESFLPGGVPDDSSLFETVGMLLLSIFFYAKLGKHVRDVRNAEPQESN